MMCQNIPQVVTVDRQPQVAAVTGQTVTIAISDNMKMLAYAVGAILLFKALK